MFEPEALTAVSEIEYSRSRQEQRFGSTRKPEAAGVCLGAL
jgi:hypothetical protein